MAALMDRWPRDRPVCVVNCAAYTQVDRAETEPERAFAINEAGPGHLATHAARVGAGLVHVSTDYVFPGVQDRPYEITDPTGPRSVYGASKLAGEQAVLQRHPQAHVVRTAWVYSVARPSFVATMIRLAGERPTWNVVDDQTGSPTWSADLAAGLVDLVSHSVPGGLLHATGGGRTTWFGLARAVLEELGQDPERVQPTTTAAMNLPAPRPAYSVLSATTWQQAGLAPLPEWRSALHRAFLRDRPELRAPA